MQATTNPIAQVLASQGRYSAPLFQRPYVWGREANWEPFWETVREVADHFAAGEQVRPRFLGAIVLEQVNVPVGQLPTRQIIDGQQRLTTLQILLAAVRDVYLSRCQANDWPPTLSMTLQQLTENFPPFSSPDEKFKVWPTNADRVHFTRAMSAGSPSKLAEQYGVPAQWQEGPARNPRTYILGQSDDPVVQRALDFWDGWSDEERGLA